MRWGGAREDDRQRSDVGFPGAVPGCCRPAGMEVRRGWENERSGKRKRREHYGRLISREEVNGKNGFGGRPSWSKRVSRDRRFVGNVSKRVFYFQSLLDVFARF